MSLPKKEKRILIGIAAMEKKARRYTSVLTLHSCSGNSYELRIHRIIYIYYSLYCFCFFTNMIQNIHSKPMMEIMRRFDPKLFEFVIFGDEVLLNSAVADWPIVDYLFAWYSNNYPLDKANDYVKLRNVPCINDVNIQHQVRKSATFTCISIVIYYLSHSLF